MYEIKKNSNSLIIKDTQKGLGCVKLSSVLSGISKIWYSYAITVTNWIVCYL